VLLYAEEESDITDLVLNKLGIKAPVAGEKAEEPATKPAPVPVQEKGSTPAKKPGNKK